MSLINICNLSFAYEGSYDYIFKNVSFSIDTDWKLGFCGRNGRGKTTFLKLLMGEFEYSGKITASVNFEYFPFEVKNRGRSTLEILQDIVPDADVWKIQKEIFKLCMDESTLCRPFDTLSHGEQTKALLAGLFLRENNFLLIDEPTNHLDMASRTAVSRYLNSKKGFILVSHDRAILDDCADHILSVNKTNIEIIKGNFSTWLMQKNRRDNFEMGQNERLSKDIAHLKKAAARTAQWAGRVEASKNEKNSGLRPDKGYVGGKAAKMMRRSKAIERRQLNAAEEKSGLLKNIERADDIQIKPLEFRTEKLLELYNVSINYNGSPVVNNFNLTLNRGERIALLGGNGSGKSSILKLICGENIPYTGQVIINNDLIISYVPQDASFLAGSLTDYVRQQHIDETLFKSMLSKLDFSQVQFEKDMKDYSAGQKKKVLLARSFCESAHVYVWDEPLNFVDVLSRMQIEDLILRYKPTMVFVEHDKAFCDKTATKVIELTK